VQHAAASRGLGGCRRSSRRMTPAPLMLPQSGCGIWPMPRARCRGRQPACPGAPHLNLSVSMTTGDMTIIMRNKGTASVNVQRPKSAARALASSLLSPPGAAAARGRGAHHAAGGGGVGAAAAGARRRPCDGGPRSRAPRRARGTGAPPLMRSVCAATGVARRRAQCSRVRGCRCRGVQGAGGARGGVARMHAGRPALACAAGGSDAAHLRAPRPAGALLHPLRRTRRGRAAACCRRRHRCQGRRCC
jgi:hypothetical protein